MSWRRSKLGVPRPVTYVGLGQPSSKVKRHKASETHGIPSLNGGESLSFAARVRTDRDVGEATEGGDRTIQQRIKEAEWALAFRD